ncbi:DUF2188 domain-containing protein [Phytoactinopolyspora halotolerans]|uniref:DUF2188 domain-containing protein n=1 Tax=Phytoactinopolyspora halotolerans TaxID=1981512 RepID=A0A6L9S6R7_9ACTN|nr:DUF2188 domain-containing protein [Phytoactinopolyspora halotolerans]NEE01155.1 DUF2188 domain-containing protein [Phytoactinopolyspora halotolerans]
MPGQDIHTVPHGDGWANIVEGGKRPISTAARKAEAREQGREEAKKRGVEHFIHKRDGTIGERNTYPRSRDPRHIEG